METTEERVAELQRQGLYGRLLKGSEILGDYWRKNVRCASGWSATCACAEKATPFCGVKLKWVGILKEYHRGALPYGMSGAEPFFVIEAMTARMFAATGLTVTVHSPEGVPIKVGPKGTNWRTIIDLGKIDGTDDYFDLLNAVAKIQGAGL